MKDTIYSREQYLRKKAAEKEPLNIQLTNNYAFRKLFKMNYICLLYTSPSPRDRG